MGAVTDDLTRDDLVLHGSAASRALRVGAAGLPVWAGVVPLATVAGTPEPDRGVDTRLGSATVTAAAAAAAAGGRRGAPSGLGSAPSA